MNGKLCPCGKPARRKYCSDKCKGRFYEKTESGRAARKRTRKKNWTKLLQWHRDYYQRTTKRKRELARQYYYRHRKKRLEWQLQYAAKNREKENARAKLYREHHPDLDVKRRRRKMELEFALLTGMLAK